MNNDFQATETNYQPWGEAIPAAIGATGNAMTSLGRPFVAWKPDDSVVKDEFKYWCHGFSTGSYEQFGYSPFSGEDMETILEDEFRRIDKKPSVGDILVFRGASGAVQQGQSVEGQILHSARIVTATHHRGRSTDVRLDSKNGASPLAKNVSIETVLRAYQNCYWFKWTGCLSMTKSEKQYYRPAN